MMPSYWAQYCAAVAEVTGLTTDYIWQELPLAVGRQYEATYLMKYRVKIIQATKAVVKKDRGLKKIVQ